MRKYLRLLPTTIQVDHMPDAWIVFPSKEMRDRILEDGSIKSIAIGDAIALSPEEISLWVSSLPDTAPEYNRFIEWCQAHWPCELTDSGTTPITLDEFNQVYKLEKGYPPS